VRVGEEGRARAGPPRRRRRTRAEAPQRLRRQLLGEELDDEQLAVVRAPDRRYAPAALRSAPAASGSRARARLEVRGATSRDSARMRPM
jgi:hypothetical protein